MIRLDAGPRSACSDVLPVGGLPGMADLVGVACRTARRLPWRSLTACMLARAALRALRLARSMRATSSAGISYSVRSRQANTTKVAKAPTSADDHHPPDVPDQREAHEVAKNAQMKPVGLLRGISIASYSGSSRRRAALARAA